MKKRIAYFIRQKVEQKTLCQIENNILKDNQKPPLKELKIWGCKTKAFRRTTKGIVFA